MYVHHKPWRRWKRQDDDDDEDGDDDDEKEDVNVDVVEVTVTQKAPQIVESTLQSSLTGNLAWDSLIYIFILLAFGCLCYALYYSFSCCMGMYYSFRKKRGEGDERILNQFGGSEILEVPKNATIIIRDGTEQNDNYGDDPPLMKSRRPSILKNSAGGGNMGRNNLYLRRSEQYEPYDNQVYYSESSTLQSGPFIPSFSKESSPVMETESYCQSDLINLDRSTNCARILDKSYNHPVLYSRKCRGDQTSHFHRLLRKTSQTGHHFQSDYPRHQTSHQYRYPPHQTSHQYRYPPHQTSHQYRYPRRQTSHQYRYPRHQTSHQYRYAPTVSVKDSKSKRIANTKWKPHKRSLHLHDGMHPTDNLGQRMLIKTQMDTLLKEGDRTPKTSRRGSRSFEQTEPYADRDEPIRFRGSGSEQSSFETLSDISDTCSPRHLPRRKSASVPKQLANAIQAFRDKNNNMSKRHSYDVHSRQFQQASMSSNSPWSRVSDQSSTTVCMCTFKKKPPEYAFRPSPWRQLLTSPVQKHRAAKSPYFFIRSLPYVSPRCLKEPCSERGPKASSQKCRMFLTPWSPVSYRR